MVESMTDAANTTISPVIDTNAFPRPVGRHSAAFETAGRFGRGEL